MGHLGPGVLPVGVGWVRTREPQLGRDGLVIHGAHVPHGLDGVVVAIWVVDKPAHVAWPLWQGEAEGFEGQLGQSRTYEIIYSIIQTHGKLAKPC